MRTAQAYLRRSELDRTRYPELRDQVLRYEAEDGAGETRDYPGYPRWVLERVRPRYFAVLDRALARRRCVRELGTALPSRASLSRMLYFAHGAHGGGNRGPVPSAGSLQALELYLVVFEPAWLPKGLYHYARAGHYLAQLAAGAERAAWRACAPSLGLLSGGALLWVLVGDGARLERKYGERGGRFLLLEAGHLMQNLCLLSASLGLSTVPLGGYFESEIAAQFALPEGDAVLYLGLCGFAP